MHKGKLCVTAMRGLTPGASVLQLPLAARDTVAVCFRQLGAGGAYYQLAAALVPYGILRRSSHAQNLRRWICQVTSLATVQPTSRPLHCSAALHTLLLCPMATPADTCPACHRPATAGRGASVPMATHSPLRSSLRVAMQQCSGRVRHGEIQAARPQ